MAPDIRWEYKVVDLKRAARTNQYDMRDLNDHGNQGWEVVGILPEAQRDSEGIFWTTVSLLLLKRPKT